MYFLNGSPEMRLSRRFVEKWPDPLQPTPEILQDTFAAFNLRPEADRVCHFEMDYLSKFWCTLAFVEQYWNDAKRLTREQCDYTITKLKLVFPIALATATPPHRMRRFMQRSLDHAKALADTGRDGDFT